VRQGRDEALNATAIAADLFRSVLYAVRIVSSVRSFAIGEGVLLVGGAVTNALLGALTICWDDPPANRADGFLALFVLPRRSARLTCVDE
jgi:hypothetical protein